VIHTTHKEFPLSNQDCVPSLIPTHQNPSTIICKTTKQTKNKKIKIKNFKALKTPHLQ
jgi:hypothetical protein